MSLYGYTCENDGGAQPLTRREFVVINDNRKQHGEQFTGESDGDERQTSEMLQGFKDEELA